MLDRFVPEVILNAPRIVAGIGQGVAAGVPQHVDVNREAKQLIGLTQPLYKPIDGVGSERPTAFSREYEGRRRLLIALQLAQGRARRPEWDAQLAYRT